MKHSKSVLCAGITGFVVFVAGIALGWFGFPVIIRQEIKSGVLLTNNSEAFERWRKLPLPIQFKVYLFNVSNPDEVMNGANPIVKEIGPYFYDQYREKYDIEDAGNDTLSYYENSTFFFNKEKSGDDLSEDDVITILNLPLLGTALKVQELYSMVLDMMNPVLKAVFVGSDSIFITARVGDLLWDGLTVIDCTRNISSSVKSICKMLPSQLPQTIVEVSPGIFHFSIFGHKNNSNPGRYRVNRGTSDTNALGHIEEWNEESTVSNWLGKTCNMINGTDSTIFPPFRTSKDKLYIFIPDVCRSLNAEYVKDVKVEGVPALHYVASKHLLADPKQYSPNMCFCRGDEDDPPENWNCLKEGALNLVTCMGVPVIMTFPHFFNASPDYTNYVEGLKPDAAKHQTYTDLEPNTGIPLRGAKRMQMNMFLTRISEITALKNVSEGLFPVVWMEEAHEVDATVLEKLHNLYIGLTVTTVAKYLVPSVGAVLLAGASKVVMCGVGKCVCCGSTCSLTCFK